MWRAAPIAARGGIGPPSIDDVRQPEERLMSKGMERKREEKKKPAKTLEEKRAAKKAKRAERG
jgi:hypothetical protein